MSPFASSEPPKAKLLAPIGNYERLAGDKGAVTDGAWNGSAPHDNRGTDAVMIHPRMDQMCTGQALDSHHASLEKIGLLSRAENDGLDRLAKLAVKLADAPVGLISIVIPEQDRQFFKSAVGLPEPWKSRQETPLSHSFCRLVRQLDLPLVVTDARSDARVCDNLAIRDLGVAAYLGAPLHGPDGEAIGALCAIDVRPRHWSLEQQAYIAELAAAADEQIALLAAIYERDQAVERAQRAAMAKSRFLATMSHEIRTPLFGVLGMAEFLEDATTEAERRRVCGTIRDSGAVLLSVLDDILDLSKIEAGKLQLEQTVFSATDLASKVEVLHRPAAERKGLSFVVEVGETDSPRRGDPHRLQQILHNLLSNAVKFTDAGMVRLKLVGEPNAPFIIEVQDTGIGMTEEQAARVFEAFEQGDDSTTRRFGGTGLGMSIVRALVQQMHGTVEVESSPNMGTTMRVVLPLPEAGDGAAVETAARVDQKSDALQGLRLLVVDDTATNRMILKAMLTKVGVQVTLAENGCEALQAWEPGRFDLLLLDIAMPDVDGFGVLRSVRERAQALGVTPPPAIAITASMMLDDVRRYRAAGFDGYVGKPFLLETLVKEIARFAPALK